MRARHFVFVLALGACDQKDDSSADAASALSAILPRLPPPPMPSAIPSASIAITPMPIPTASASAHLGDGGLACGTKPLPDCPLQAWMKKNMTPPMEAKDWLGMADALERAATVAPPNYATTGYVNWVSIAHDGANAARAADMNAIKAACRGCHDQYKNKYRTEMRTRPVP